MNQVKSYTVLAQQIKEMLTPATQKTAGAPDAKDPAEKGGVPHVTDPDASPEKMALPSGEDAPKDPIAPGIRNGEKPNTLPTKPLVDPSITSPTDPNVVTGPTVKSALAEASAQLRQALATAGKTNAAPAAAPSAPAVKKAAEPQAVILEELGKDFLSKIAADLLASEEGAQLLQRHYVERFGAQQSEEIVKTALALFPDGVENQNMSNLYNTLTAASQPASPDYFASLSQAQAKQASTSPQPTEADIANFVESLPPHVKQAAANLTKANEECISYLRSDEELRQFQQGQLDAIHLMKAAAAQEAQPAIPMGGESPGIEEIIQALMEMGLTEDQIAQLLQEAMGQMQGQAGPQPGM